MRLRVPGGRAISENELPKKLSFDQYFVHKLGGMKSPFSNLSQVSGLRQRGPGKDKFIFTRDELFWINSLAYLV